LNHLVGGGQQNFRECNAKRLGGFHVDDQFDLGSLLHWQIAGLLPFEDAPGVNPDLTGGLGRIRSVAQKCAFDGSFALTAE
jgi:hypothetical protein